MINDPRLLAEHLEFYRSPTDKVTDALMFQEMESVDYAYETMWMHVRENVNPHRVERGLEPMSREDSDSFARGIVNFCERLRLQREANDGKPVEEEDGEDARSFFELLVDSGLATHDPAVLHSPFELLPKKEFVLTAPHLESTVYPDSVPAHRKPPKWQKNLPPQVKRKLGGKGHRFRGGGRGRRGR